MKCPDDIVESLTEILRLGLLRARAAGWDGDAERSAIEVDHLHNLPSLLDNFSPARLRYYLEAEVPTYAAQSIQTTEFAPHWKLLQEHLEHQLA